MLSERSGQEMEQQNEKKEINGMDIPTDKKNKDRTGHIANMRSPRLTEQEEHHLEMVEEYTSDKSINEQIEDIEHTADLFCTHFFDTRSNSSWSVFVNDGGSASPHKCVNGFSKGEHGINFANYHSYRG